jgi:hypothetical protein
MYTSKGNHLQYNSRFASLAAALFLLLLLVSALLSACTPASTTQVAPPPTTPQPGDAGGGLITKDKAPFAVAAKQMLAEKLGVNVDQIEFVAANTMEWSDSCLGLGGPAESCLMAVTPGYLVKLKVNGVEYEVRTDEEGKAVRIKE